VLGCAIMYILLITEHKGDVSLQKKKKCVSWKKSKCHCHLVCMCGMKRIFKCSSAWTHLWNGQHDSVFLMSGKEIENIFICKLLYKLLKYYSKLMANQTHVIV